MMRLILLFTVLIAPILTTSCVSKSKKNRSLSSGEYRLVLKVVDGDTFYLEDGSSKGERIRLIGVDAPESKSVFKKKKAYYGDEAKSYLISLLEDQKVKLVYDVDRLDPYGRTLAYVYMENGTFVNAELVKNGFAMVMTVPPNVKFADEFVRLQQEARENNRGLWGLKY